MKTKKILIIEDDEAIRTLLKTALAAYTVIVANGGKEGLEIAYKENPDVILLDIMMDEVTGIDVMADFQKNKPDLLEKIIIMTNASENTFVAKALEYNVTSFLVKGDYDIADIVAVVQKKLGK